MPAESSSPTRRSILATAAAAGAASLLNTNVDTAAEGDAIRPFRVNIPEAELTELRRRINATRWPDRETVTNESQGVQLATMQELAHYWGTDYDWRKCETRLNALPQFITEIDGLNIHFIHVRSKHENALPLIVAHGWPGSVIEQLNVLFAKRRAYAQMMGTRPQALTGLTDSPVGLAAWLFDHGDGYGQPAAAITSAVLGRTVDGHPAGDLTRDDVLDDFTLYWLTNTAVSAARYYWESRINLYNAADVPIPAAVTVFPGENYQAPRSWAERAYHKLIYYNKVDQGGHYAAWEQPKLFSEEVRAGFRPLRK